MTTDLTGLIPHGWTGGEAVTKWWRGKFIHLYRLRKNCAQCGREMTIDVTKAAIVGEAKNAGLHLVRCSDCRVKTPRDIMSRPSVRGDSPVSATDTSVLQNTDELEALRAQNEMFLRSIQALQAQNIELNKQLSALRSKYELQPAMAALSKLPPEPLTMAQSTALLAKAVQNKMPWEQK